MQEYRHVGLMVEGLSGYGNKILTGVSRYVHQNSNWRVAFFDRERDEMAGLLKSWQGDAIICSAADARFVEAAAGRTIPIVNVTSRHLAPAFTNIVSDDHQAGAHAAEFLLGRGFRSFAYVRRQEEDCFEMKRAEGFTATVQAAGFPVESGLIHSADDAELAEWLAGLPRPLAVLGTTDRLAAMTLDACWKLGIRVPEEIALLGIGNYEQLCDLCSPTLSSVDLDLERRGFEAARWIDRLLQGEARPDEPQLIPPRGIQERQSTNVYAFDDPDVVAALRFIRDSSAQTIKVRDVVAATRISRRSLEGRFNKLIGRTLHDEIWQAHFDLAMRLLSSSDLSLQEVAGRSGFRTASALVNLFRQRFQMTPKEYRVANRR
jgi:LacI family transcriptional regulator